MAKATKLNSGEAANAGPETPAELLPAGLLRFSEFSPAQKCLCLYAAVMALLLIVVWGVSWFDERTLREVGIWAKPMKFLAGTALFAATTMVLSRVVAPQVGQGRTFQGIAALLIVTSLFEVAYISFQAAWGEGSHYNTRDAWHAMLFGLMAVAAVGLVASQAWLAWEIWQIKKSDTLTPLTLAVLLGLVLTFVLSTISGFMLGGQQPMVGVGLPVFGWHASHDLRPAHFLAVHAQQFIPLVGWWVQRLGLRSSEVAGGPWGRLSGRLSGWFWDRLWDRFWGGRAGIAAVLLFSAAYVAVWLGLSVMGAAGKA